MPSHFKKLAIQNGHKCYHSAMLKAYITLLAGYLGWGLFPLYWQLLSHIPPLEVTMHRVIWSIPVLAVLVHVSLRRRRDFLRSIHSAPQLRLLLITAILITINWGVYVWAVTNARVLEASMGYYLTPLINIAAGVIIFRETLSRLKWLAICVAMAGVLYYVLAMGSLPWVALTVGISFSSYGILRKQIATGPIVGLYIETLMIAPFALAVLLYLHQQNSALFLHTDIPSDIWLILGGLVTVIPLALFTTGARLLPMTSVGILFFITPSLQFLVGSLVLGEPVNSDKLISFIIIWLALILYSVSLLKSKPPDGMS